MKKPTLLPMEEALSRIIDVASARPRGIEMLPVAEADGRVLAQSLSALRTQPPYALSTMDGFALQAADTTPPGQPLRIMGESAAGHAFSGIITKGEAIRIYTGARLPEGADAVLLQERARVEGETLFSEISLAPGTFIRAKGADFARGEALLEAGTCFTPACLALAAAMNHAKVPVFQRPRIALLATGDELVNPGTADDDAIIATNIIAIAAMARAAGAIIIDLGIARDNRESLTAAFLRAKAEGADCLVTIGGASVGKHDLVRPVAESLGARLDFYKIAMRPGKPLNFGTLDAMLLLGLPGNPVSSILCTKLFLVPLIATLQGETRQETVETALLGAALKENDERQDYLRATLTRNEEGALVATAFQRQDSALLSVLAKAQALIIRPPFAPAAEAGEACRILRL